jgi:hypothetical protein
MAQRGVSVTTTFDAWYGGSRKTGDAANITVDLHQDGGAGVQSTNACAELAKSGGGGSGRYKVVLTAAERQYNHTRISPRSATSGVECGDVSIYTDAQIGARLVTITVTEADLTPIAGVSVAIYDSTQTNVNLLCVTDASGIARIQGTTALAFLDDGSYKIVCSKAGVNFTNPTSLTVDGTETVAIEGTLVDPGTPSANLCRITGYAKRGDETVIEGALVKITLKDRPMIGDLTVFSPKEVKAASDATGYFEIDYEQGATVTVSIMDGQTTCASFSVTIPDEVSIDIEALYALA